MDPKFLNVCSFTKRTLKEEARKARPTGTWVLLSLGLVYFVAFSIFVLLSGGTLGIVLGSFLLVLSVLYLILALFGPDLDALKKAKRDQAHFNGPMHTTYAFYDDSIHVECVSNGKTRDLRYEQLVAIEETKNLYLLHTRLSTFPIAKNGFRTGKAEDFPAFLAECAPDAENSIRTGK